MKKLILIFKRNFFSISFPIILSIFFYMLQPICFFLLSQFLFIFLAIFFFPFFSIKRNRVMNFIMDAKRDKDKIGNIIVKFISIFMMNKFVSSQLPTQRLRHYESVFSYIFPVSLATRNPYSSIPSSGFNMDSPFPSRMIFSIHSVWVSIFPPRFRSLCHIFSIYFFLLLVNCFIFTNLTYSKDYSMRFPTGTAMETYTPNNPPPGGSGDTITVGGVAVDTTANFTNDGNVDFTLVDGGAGGPDAIKADFTELDPTVDTSAEIQAIIGAGIYQASGNYQPLATILTTLSNLANGSGALTNNGAGTLSYVSYLTAEVDGSTTNEINTITLPDANVTAGLGITFAQSGAIAITESAPDTVTFTVTEADPLSATKALNNLTSVAINTSLISDLANTDDLGTEAIYWKKLYLASDISFEGSTDDEYQTTLTAVDTTLSDKSINIPNASGTVAVSATAPATLSALGDIGVTVLKDIVTTAPLTGAADDVLPGADSDLTLAITMTGDLVTTAPITGAADNIFPGDGTKATIGITLAKDIVAGVGLSGGEDNVLPGADADTTLTFDATELGDLTFGAGVPATMAWTFSLSGVTDPVATWGNDLLTLSNSLTLTTGNNFTIGSTQWNSGDSIDGTKVANADLGDIGVASGAWSVENDSHDHSAAGSTVTIAAADITDKNAGTDITADLEEETHASEHAPGGTDTVFFADPNADRLVFWNDTAGAIQALDYSTWDITAYTGGDFLTLTGHDFDVDTAAVSNGDTTHVPTANGVFDFCETTQAYLQAADLVGANEVYDATGWDADTGIPEKDDIRDKLETMPQTAGDALTLTGTDIDFDGGASPGGELGGTWASPTIDDSLAVSSWSLTTPTIIGNAIFNNGATSSGSLSIYEDSTDGSEYASFQVPALAANTVYTLPADDGGVGEILSTNGSGVLDWVADAGGAETNSLETVCTGIATTEIPIGTAADTVVYAALSGEATMANNGAVTLADSVAVTSWNLTTPTITTSLTTDSKTISEAEIGRLDGLTSAIIDDDKIDTFAELDTIVTDKALVNKADGAVWLGVHDFGGATSTEIVNGANPTTDAAGEIAVDSSAAPGSGIRFYGDAAYTIAGTYSKSFVILNPVATDDYPLWCTPYAITIKHVRVQCLGGTNIVGQLTECDAEGVNAAVVDDSDITATANNSVDDDGTLSNPSIDALDYVGWKTESISGTPTSVTVTFDYTINQVD
jgi:hypothetical protein